VFTIIKRIVCAVRVNAREEVLEACFADLLKGLVFDDQVMDWIVDALHQSHNRRETIARSAACCCQVAFRDSQRCPRTS
jgi:hypothetical protein